MAYELDLPSYFAIVDSVYYVSMFRQYIPDTSHMLSWGLFKLDEQLTFVEDPALILGSDVKCLCTRDIPVVKVQ